MRISYRTSHPYSFFRSDCTDFTTLLRTKLKKMNSDAAATAPESVQRVYGFLIRKYTPMRATAATVAPIAM